MQSFSFKLPTGTDFEVLLQPPVCSLVLCGCLVISNKKSECFPCCLLSPFISYCIWEPMKIPSLIFGVVMCGNLWCIYQNFLYSCSLHSQKSFIPSLMWRGGRTAFCGTTSGSFVVLLQLEENALSETILSQHSHYFLCDWSIHISINTTACN